MNGSDHGTRDECSTGISDARCWPSHVPAPIGIRIRNGHCAAWRSCSTGLAMPASPSSPILLARAPPRYSGLKRAASNGVDQRSEEHTSELQSLIRISYAVFCLKKKKRKTNSNIYDNTTSQEKN